MAEMGCRSPHVDPALSFQNLDTRSFEAICFIAASEALIENGLEPASCGHWEVNAAGTPGSSERVDFNRICHGNGLDEDGDALRPEEMEQLLISGSMRRMGAMNFPKQVTELFGGLRNIAAAAAEYTRIAGDARKRIHDAKAVVEACAKDPWVRRGRIALGALPGIWSPHDASEATDTTNEEREALLYSFYMITGVKECFREKFSTPLAKGDDGVAKFFACIAPAGIIEKTDQHGNTISYYVVDTDMAKMADSAVSPREFPYGVGEEMYVAAALDAAGRASGDAHFILVLLADYYVNLSQASSDEAARRKHLEHARRFISIVSEEYLDARQLKILGQVNERIGRVATVARRTECPGGMEQNDMGTGCVDTEESCRKKGLRLMPLLDSCEAPAEGKAAAPTEARSPVPSTPAEPSASDS